MKQKEERKTKIRRRFSFVSTLFNLSSPGVGYGITLTQDTFVLNIQI